MYSKTVLIIVIQPGRSLRADFPYWAPYRKEVILLNICMVPGSLWEGGIPDNEYSNKWAKE